MRFDLLYNNPEFIPIIAKWYHDQWGSSAYVLSKENEEEKLHSFLNEKSIPLILTGIENKTLIGVAQLKEAEMKIFPSYRYWLGGVYVDSKFRNRGVGRSLVLNAIDKARKLNIEKLYLQTEILNGGLYTKLGWTKIEEVVYNGTHVAVMVNTIVR